MSKWRKRQTMYSWKAPSIILVGSLITFILVVPTLIVLPFIQSAEVEKETVSEQKEIEEVIIEASDSPFSVHVFRSNKETTESVPLEDYVTRVVASEMPADFELEALKAQALTARTYIVNYLMHKEENSLPGNADVTDTVQHQVYKSDQELREQWGTDYNWKINKIRQAVAATMGEIVTYEGEPITPAFFSTSNGYTEDSEKYWQNELPYLRSVESPWDEESPKYLDQKIFTIEQVENALGINLAQSNGSFQMERTKSNRVASIALGGKTFTGRDVREKLDLNSSDFEIKQKGDHLVFTTKGYGHGVGMSQYGANGMAKEGETYKDIISYYYQGAEVDQVDYNAPKLAAKK
ncbi:stage II sporulation protein D [Aquibacillus albus]|uniref:Stage II sporulation protein D n=1 Tax=Aquibacillus albus TaxID=1168171 RepID=A0ABS2MZS8_9BACI|nr:stage II sporulation protein D [Aquibacillus albus]MBM7571298.1 stage II sporulation protein D [Aquibacillus albus]